VHAVIHELQRNEIKSNHVLLYIDAGSCSPTGHNTPTEAPWQGMQAMHHLLMPHSVPAAGLCGAKDYCIMNCNVMK
jgi:hypothetical protein